MPDAQLGLKPAAFCVILIDGGLPGVGAEAVSRAGGAAFVMARLHEAAGRAEQTLDE